MRKNGGLISIEQTLDLQPFPELSSQANKPATTPVSEKTIQEQKISSYQSG
jgi:hypothetical protein